MSSNDFNSSVTNVLRFLLAEITDTNLEYFTLTRFEKKLKHKIETFVESARESFEESLENDEFLTITYDDDDKENVDDNENDSQQDDDDDDYDDTCDFDFDLEVNYEETLINPDDIQLRARKRAVDYWRSCRSKKRRSLSSVRKSPFCFQHK
ncbi:hypothetical protein SNEBB_005169 [Seison nebaliae]|nr:hypothetical protein SNEBB_005169 [Seison nebaliae]